MLQELGSEYSGCCDFRCRVVFQYLIDLLPVVALGDGLRAESGHHSRDGTRVVVYAVILGVYPLA